LIGQKHEPWGIGLSLSPERDRRRALYLLLLHGNAVGANSDSNPYSAFTGVG
jgi:hypothetical protein